MKILVTGGAGYIGNFLVRKLLAEGYQVTIIDSFQYGTSAILDLVNHPKFHVTEKDIRNIEKSDIQDTEFIFHLAAVSGLPACRKDTYTAQTVNVDATRKLVKLLSPDQIIIYASTTSLYGSSGKKRDEKSTPEPLSQYSQTKYQAEKIIMEHHSSVSLRFATLFGVSACMRTDLLVNNFVYRALTDRSLVVFDPLSVRTYLHLKDAISAYLLVLRLISKMKGNIYNVGTNSLNFSKLDLARHIQNLIDCEVYQSHLTDIDKRNFIISYDRINSLGFKSIVSLDDGIKELIKLYSFYRPDENRDV